MDFALPDREGLQRMVVLLASVSHMFRPSTRSEYVGELSNRENPFVHEVFSFTLCHIIQKTKVIFFNSLLLASDLVFALGTMSVQDEIWRFLARE